MNPATPERVGWRRGDAPEALVEREWLVANALGGYATGTLAGVSTRRYHGLLVAALHGVGRAVMLSRLDEAVRLPGGELRSLGGAERPSAPALPGALALLEFRLELGLPVWTYDLGGFLIEKRVVMQHRQDTVRVTYRLLEAPSPVALELRPAVHFRPHDAPLGAPLQDYRISAVGGRHEIVAAEGGFPPLRTWLDGAAAAFVRAPGRLADVEYPVERSRGYDARGDLWSPGHFRVELASGRPVTLVASTEPWDVATALAPEVALAAEEERRRALLERAPPAARAGPAAELVLAADAFLVTPRRVDDEVRSRAEGDEPRTVIAGYHWFTDWGRDTMISLEGLTLATGRHEEAGLILRSFARHVRDGLIPNLFPEGDREGLYHTADATLWMFHAMDRYVRATGDRATLVRLLPTFEAIARAHLAGTRFGIRVDPQDGLLTQGEAGYQLTWMDAKCDGWVVTPRRGKAVELNALWYNALRVLAAWTAAERGDAAEGPWREAAGRARTSFNARFWYAAGGHLYDVVDGEAGDDASFRPNQIFAVSLPHPVLDPERWPAVVEAVRARLLTPVGLRSLAPGDPDYKPSYHGDLPTRDAAYHQGTVWSWLIGPFVDAWLAVHPGDQAGARALLGGLVAHLGEGCIGSVSEIFDAEAPFTPRGCIAQAWGVAELLRALVRAAPPG